MELFKLKMVGAMLAFGIASPVGAAQGEMGTGIPDGYSIYSPVATGGSAQIVVWSLKGASTAMPSGCSNITLTLRTLEADTYKMALATLQIAKLTNQPVRFYAHASRDAGCGVDMIQLSPN